MSEMLTLLIAVLTAISLTVTVFCFIFYRKQEVDNKDAKVKSDLEEQIDDIKTEISDNKLSQEKQGSNIREEINEKLAENKKALEEGMKQFIDILTDIKEADKNMSLQFLTTINTVKEELKNDYTSRYNDLLLLINTKADIKDINRLEAKFDRISETMVELKTVIQMQMDKKDKK